MLLYKTQRASSGPIPRVLVRMDRNRREANLSMENLAPDLEMKAAAVLFLTYLLRGLLHYIVARMIHPRSKTKGPAGWEWACSRHLPHYLSGWMSRCSIPKECVMLEIGTQYLA